MRNLTPILTAIVVIGAVAVLVLRFSLHDQGPPEPEDPSMVQPEVARRGGAADIFMGSDAEQQMRTPINGPLSPRSVLVNESEGLPLNEIYLSTVVQGLQQRLEIPRPGEDVRNELRPMLIAEMAATLTARGEDLPSSYSSDDDPTPHPDYVLTTFGTSAGTRVFRWYKYEFPELYFAFSSRGVEMFPEFQDSLVFKEIALARCERTLKRLQACR